MAGQNFSSARRAASHAAAVFVFLLAVFVGTIGSALAHASLTNAAPADGSVLPAAPSALMLSFSEPVSPLVLKLVNPDRSVVVLDRYALRDTTLDIEVPPGLATGTHVLSWRVISEDGHPVGGSVVFSIGAPSRGAPPVADAVTDWSLRTAIWAARTALYVGLFFGVGGAFFLNWLARPSRHGARFIAGALLLGLIATIPALGLQGLDALGLPLGSIMSGTVWRTGYGTSYGATIVIAAAALLAGLLSLISGLFISRALSLIALAGIGLALAASGHASAAHPQWLTRPAVFVHAIGIGFWAGALVPLGLALAARAPGAEPALRRFSRAIPLLLALMVAAGILLAIVQVETPSALLATAYGRVLLVKLALVAALFALAAYNRWRLTTPAEQGNADATRRLARVIAIETLLVLAVLGTAAVWRFTPPPRALALAAAAPAHIHIHTDKAMADLSITPGHVGPVTASIVIMTGDFGPLDAKEVTLVLSNPEAGIEPIRRPAIKPGDGTWRVDGLTIPVGGRWTARIDILVSDFELVKLEETIDIRP